MSTPSLWSAGRYDAVAEQIAPIAGAVVDAADRRAPLYGAAVVDLACGTGNATLAALARGARVTAVDLTPELIELGRQRVTGADVTWVTADAAATGLPAESFDAAVSNMGIIFVEPAGQVAELERLLKPGGTLAFSAWVRDPDNPFSAPIAKVFRPPPNPGYTPDQWGDADTVTDRLSAGFTDIRIETHTHTWRFPSLEAVMTFVTTQSPVHVAAFARADATQRDTLRNEFESALSAHCDQHGVQFDSGYVVVTARRR
ncbi:methyltransferase domain protein [Mycolicibacterium hassiacum DSM 44199]|jgi:SAM-dependent methyltransferase|uniref:Methyltransferase domain protein n=1 Tax=Mycolicibacterium hassiacum (strain DSM 44199 / CIP 105218 / JCM 12690 / 3849) TaxID=1122247 RepID=K5B8Z9_MYCHD|nr:class I SAM-dependent methyltransferase [Mycolicibacterium hassiacum]EKF24578.1 methyltransferase domain protein [Mycolicibacterium hassiacum DSM 44199]MBX5486687.1 class I SAM-dependent methyltransferase [Mycolicibacterium hassiacum]MDA4084453.1 SAM-dependent methyltransferase [Mycolicibacterium hassiacum DSM 44199]PZN20615.1 MAG: class I SAM-dependent methyltransferase [Mycolicibacterium hassiacum]VCT88869.1 Aklanonic acid methyltransferase DauC [Mycolicibacterium hassiacum DSM 44199]